MNKFILLALLSIVCSEPLCDEVYKCIDKNTIFPENNNTLNLEICEWTNHSISGNHPDTKYVKLCPDGFTCDDYSDSDFEVDVNSDFENEISFCFPKKPGSGEGAYCDVPENCTSLNCTSNKCTPVSDHSNCTSHRQCSKQSFCDIEGSDDDDDDDATYTNKCLPLVDENQPCTRSVECKFGYACGKTDITATSKTCVKMYSLPSGQYTTNKKLCQSGEKGDDDIGDISYCLDYETNVTDNNQKPTACIHDEQCKVNVIKNGTLVKEIEGECECTRFHNAKYCELGSNSYQWKRYIKVFNEMVDEYKEGKHKDLHVAAEREHNWNVIPKLYEAELLTDIENYDMPSCAIEFIINSTSSFVSSGFLKMGVFAIIGVVAVLI